MKIIDVDLDELEREIIKTSMLYYDINEVTSKEGVNNLIMEHFGTLKCKLEEHLTDVGVLFIVYPPIGIYGLPLIILLKVS